MPQLTGSYHCGAVTYTVHLDLTKPVFECNCSYCQRKWFLLSFVPKSDFELLSGEEVLTEYLFNTHKIRHRFCKVCWVQCFGEWEHNGIATRAINVRTIENIDLSKLARQAVDGKSLNKFHYTSKKESFVRMTLFSFSPFLLSQWEIMKSGRYESNHIFKIHLYGLEVSIYTISEGVSYNTKSFPSRVGEGMFNYNSYLRYLSIHLFVFGCEWMELRGFLGSEYFFEFHKCCISVSKHFLNLR